MRSVVASRAGDPSVLTLEERDIPKAKPGWVVVKVRAFGLNRAEMFTRQGHSPGVEFPRVLGIECVGEIDDPSDSNFARGQKVVALMGEMGRAFDGSYQEYALLPASLPIPVQTSLDWTTLAAIPETYHTAYGCLKGALKVKNSKGLLIRGGSSALGMATLGLAKALGLRVTSTSRSEKKAETLLALGADRVLIEDGQLSEGMDRFDYVLELIGTTTLKDSFKLLLPGGMVCFAGILGNAWTLDSFSPFTDMQSKTYFTVFGSGDASIAEMNEILGLVEAGDLKPNLFKTFPLEDLVEAHALMESGNALGKLVVVNRQ